MPTAHKRKATKAVSVEERKVGNDDDDDELEISEETKAKRHQTKRSTRNNKNKNNNDHDNNDDMIETTALHYFKNQQYGSKGIRNEMKKYSQLDIRLDPDDYHQFITNYHKQQHQQPPSSSFSSSSSSSSSSSAAAVATSPLITTLFPEEIANHLLWLGLGHHNILLYGFGNLTKIIRNYAEEYLEGEDVLEIQGNPMKGNSLTPLSEQSSSSSSSSVSVNAWMKPIRMIINFIIKNILQKNKLLLSANNTINAPSSTNNNNNNNNNNTNNDGEQSLSSYCRMICDQLNIHYGRSGDKSVNVLEGDITLVSNGSSTINNKPLTRRNMTKLPNTDRKNLKWVYAQSKLYLIVHDICGNIFHAPEAQECLSIFAACESITMIASSSSINVHLLWNSMCLYRFAWRYLQINTFQHHPIPADHPFIRTMTSGGILMKETTGEALIPVLRSLAKRHIEFLIAIGNVYLTAKTKNEHQKYHRLGGKAGGGGGGGGSYIIFSFSEAADIACAGLIVKTENELVTLMKEFIDHNILIHEVMDMKGAYLKFLISEEDFRMIILHFS